MLFALTLALVTLFGVALFGIFAIAALQMGALFVATCAGFLALTLVVGMLWCAFTVARA